MSESPWKQYYERNRERPPRPLLVRALPYVSHKDEALELGAGTGNDVWYLLSVGFTHVTAVDKEQIAFDMTTPFPTERVTGIVGRFEDLELPKNTYDLVNAQYSLPFNPRASFNAMFAQVMCSLKEGGVFVGQLFGERDEWNAGDGRMSFHSETQARELLTGLRIQSFDVEEGRRAFGANGAEKYWHVFHIIAQK